jgi:hypothetical protein
MIALQNAPLTLSRVDNNLPQFFVKLKLNQQFQPPSRSSTSQIVADLSLDDAQPCRSFRLVKSTPRIRAKFPKYVSEFSKVISPHMHCSLRPCIVRLLHTPNVGRRKPTRLWADNSLPDR